MPRIYDDCATNPGGTPEDTTRCVKTVINWYGWHMVQCSRKRGHGPNGEYCKQHAKILEKREQAIKKLHEAEVVKQT